MQIYDDGSTKVHVACVEGPGAASGRHNLALERSIVANLLDEIAPGEGLVAGHRSDGSPTLDGGRSISISHCSRLVAVATDARGRAIGVDVETTDRCVQLRRVSGRVISSEQHCEWGCSDSRRLAAWSIKEALYKAVRREGWGLREIPLPYDAGKFESGEECVVEALGRLFGVRKVGPEIGGCGPVVLVLEL